MKPTKNRVYCNDAGRAKMLFESEKKADNFIKFNTEEMLNEGKKVPVRSYYCQACGGWHVTSNPYVETFKYGSKYEAFVAKQVQLQKRIKEERAKRVVANELQSAYDAAVSAFMSGDMKKAMGKTQSYLAKLTSKHADMENFVLGYKLLYDILCQMIPEMFAYFDTDEFNKAENIYAQCNTIRGILKNIPGFENYKSVTDGYMEAAAQRIAANRKMCENIARVRLILTSIDQLTILVEQGNIAEVQSEINQFARELNVFADYKELRELVFEGVVKMTAVHDQLLLKLSSVA